METILKEETFDVCGTTKLTVGDPMYLEAIADGTDKDCEKKLVFDGSISGAPLGKLRIREIHCIENGLVTFLFIITLALSRNLKKNTAIARNIVNST